MAYETRQLRRQKVLYNSANATNLLKYQLVVDGAKVTPTSATIAVYKPSSTTAVLAATAMTVDGTLLTYALDTTTVADFPVDVGYRGDIVVTHSAETYARTIIFDVVKYLLDLNIGVDQLIAFDDRLRDVQWDGDEDFSEVILACRDVLQSKIEAKVIGDSKLVENMILDSTKVAVPARFYMLSHIWRVKGHEERADYYMTEFTALWDAVLSSIRYDEGQDGVEDSEIGGLQEVRLVQ